MSLVWRVQRRATIPFTCSANFAAMCRFESVHQHFSDQTQVWQSSMPRLSPVSKRLQEKQHCAHLHGEITFSSNALHYYRQYLLGIQCRMPKKCRPRASPDCFYQHSCFDGEHCSTSGCPYDHPVEVNQFTMQAGVPEIFLASPAGGGPQVGPGKLF